MLREAHIERLGVALGSAYRGGGLAGADVDLRRIGSAEEAVAVRRAAMAAYGGARLGTSLVATTPLTARLLGCDEPVAGPAYAEQRLASGDTLPLRPSMLGIGAQLAFVFGRCVEPDRDDFNDPVRLSGAVASCHLSLQVLGRRVRHCVPLNPWTATADFGLAEVFVQGPAVSNWRTRVACDQDVKLRLDGHVCATGTLGDTMGHPLAPVAWLARRLSETGKFIEAGDVVTTGSVTGLLQVRPGQVATGDFGELGTVQLALA